MPRDRWRPVEGDYCTKGTERGQVVKKISQRTGKPYLTVRILSGPRRMLHEFPERGWELDDGSYGGNERPAHEPDDYLGSYEHKTEHHSRRS